MSTHIPAFARRTCDGLARIGATRFDVVGARFFNDDQGAAGGGDQGNADQQGDGGRQVPWTKENFDPARAEALFKNLTGDIDKLRSGQQAAIDAAVQQANQANKDTLAELGRLLTGEAAPETDPVKLNDAITGLKGQITERDTALTAAQASVKAGQVALQVAIHGAPLGANVTALLANEDFKTAIASVEPTDGAAITAAITKALQANAALKQPPARSGSGEHTGPTVTSLQQQLAEAEKAKDLSTVISLKRRIAATKATTA